MCDVSVERIEILSGPSVMSFWRDGGILRPISALRSSSNLVNTTHSTPRWTRSTPRCSHADVVVRCQKYD